MISNLVSNSIESIPKGVLGKISCRLSMDLEENTCKVAISDNGKGIPFENLEKVFDEHFTSGKRSGNGLGLYYVRKKVQDWSGAIEIHSSVVRGTTVEMVLRVPKKATTLKLLGANGV